MKRYYIKGKGDGKMVYNVTRQNKNYFEAIIEANNKEHNEYLKMLDERNKYLQKVIDDRDKRGIPPDPKLVEEIKAHLIGAGIINEKGELTKHYGGEA